MRITVLADHKIEVTLRENTKKIEVVTPKGRLIEFDNTPPETFTYDVKGLFGTIKKKSIPVELKTRVNEFLDYTWDRRSNKQFIETKELDQYPLWRCVKWQFSGDTGIYMFNFVRQKILLYSRSGKLFTTGNYGPCRNSDAELKINMKGVLELEQDVLERVLEADAQPIWPSTQTVPIAPPSYEASKDNVPTVSAPK